MLKTQEYIKKHGLKNLIDTFQLRANYHKDYPNLVQLCYHQLNTPKNDITNECRGLILDTSDDYKVISYPFYRFPDYDFKNHKNNKIDLNKISIYEKLDGSICVIYFYDNKWHVSTKGLPDANGEILDLDGKTYNDYFWEVWNELEYELPKETDMCFMFEFRIPTDRFLVRCHRADIILIGTRSLYNFCEYDLDEISYIKNRYNWQINKKLDITIEEAFDNIKKCNPLEFEGYVFVDENFNRAKVKSPQYEAINQLRINTYTNPEEWFKRQEQIKKDNFRRLCEIVRTNLHDRFLNLEKYKPLRNDYYEIRRAYLELSYELSSLVNKTLHLEGKELGLVMKSYQEYNGLVFGIKKKTVDSVYDYLFNMDIRNFEKLIKKYL